MYLKAERYIPGYAHNKDADRKAFKSVVRAAGLKLSQIASDSPSLTVSVHAGYWRKANAIHAWFVKNVQDGKDDRQRAYVSREQLQQLLNDAEAALAAGDKAKEILPTQAGFFFGSTEYGEWYIRNLRNTIRQVKQALDMGKEWSFYYQASW